MQIFNRAYYKFIDDMINVREENFKQETFANILNSIEEIPFLRHFDLNVSIYKVELATAKKCRAVLFNERLDCVLAIKGFNSEKWTLPGGCLEEEEDKNNKLLCVRREISEELGLKIDFCFESKVNLFTHYFPQIILEDTKFSPEAKGEVEYIA